MRIPLSRGLLGRTATLALLLVGACGGDSGGPNPPPNNDPPPTPSPTGTDIDIEPGASTRTTTAFNPNPRTVSIGAGTGVSVRWVNRDITGGEYQTGTATAHNITPDNAGDFTPSGVLGGNKTHQVTLTAPGTYPYHCSIHPDMVGTVIVNP